MQELFDVFVAHLNDWLNAGNLIEGALIGFLYYDRAKWIKRYDELINKNG